MKTLKNIYAVIITTLAAVVYGVILIPACCVTFVIDIVCAIIAIIDPDRGAYAFTMRAIYSFKNGIQNCYSEIKYYII